MSPIPEIQQIEEASPSDIENDVIGMNILTFSGDLGTQASTAKPEAELATEHQDGRLSPIPEFQQIEEASPDDIENSVIGIHSLRFGANLSTEAPTSTPVVAVATQHQEQGLHLKTGRSGRLDSQITRLPPVQEVTE